MILTGSVKLERGVSGMEEGRANFHNLPPEKQRNIIDTGLNAFGRNGYAKTSMNDVARAAGVSKAALFYYFGTKQALYQYLFQFSCEIISREMREGNDDFFDCLWLASEIKLRVMQSYSGLYPFLLSLVKEDNRQQELERSNQCQIEQAVALLFRNVNWEKLKPEIDRVSAYQMVTYVSGGFIRDHAEEPPEKIMEGLKPLLELLKKALYREEYL